MFPDIADAVASQLPAETVVASELIAMRAGRIDFTALTPCGGRSGQREPVAEISPVWVSEMTSCTPARRRLIGPQGTPDTGRH